MCESGMVRLPSNEPLRTPSMLYKNYPERAVRHTLSVPIIWMVLIPIVFLDVAIEIYHRICFPLFGLPIINRAQFIRIDRQRLTYLPWWDRANCAYCSYANGFLNYAAMIAARTEEYWCGIKHEAKPPFLEPKHHESFLEYGDEEGYSHLGPKGK